MAPLLRTHHSGLAATPGGAPAAPRAPPRGRRALALAGLFALGAVVLLAWSAAVRPCDSQSGQGTPRAVMAGQRRGGSSSSAAVGALSPQQQQTAAAAPFDLHLVLRLLPLTNLSALTTGALLDASPGLSLSDTWELVRLHQEVYCRAHLHQPDPPGSARVHFGNVTIFIYRGNDIVSHSLGGAAHTWELREVHEMLWAMRAPAPLSPADDGDASKWRKAPSPFVVDIGANLGWFTLNAAAAGGTVAAFEAMSSNVALIRASLCANPWLMERTALYGTGLGTRRTNCFLISGKSNQGDGHTVCGETLPDYLARQDPNDTYAARGEVSLFRLDSLLDRDVQVMKLDVEGFESEVLRGASMLLTRRRVLHIMSEVNVGILGAEKAHDFLRFLSRSGYVLSLTSFKGPFYDAATIAAGAVPLAAGGAPTVYAVLRSVAVGRGAVAGVSPVPSGR